MRRDSHKPQKNTYLMILAAVSALVAILLFLDTAVPIFPASADLPSLSGARPSDDDSDGTDGEETHRSWWEGLFGRDETEEPAESDTEPVTVPNLDLDHVVVDWVDDYTDDEMYDAWHKILTRSLYTLSELEAQGEILPICEVGLFNIDLMGAPEILVKSHTDENQFVYTVYDIYMSDTIAFWTGGVCDWEMLCLWKMQDAASYTVLFEHYGDGGDEYVYTVTPSHLDLEECWACETNGTTTTYWLNGQQVDRDKYEEARFEFHTDYEQLINTAARFVVWQSADGEAVAKALLCQGQQFIRTEQTEP